MANEMPRTQQVYQLLQARGGAMTIKAMAESLDMDPIATEVAVYNLRDRKLVMNAKKKGQHGLWFIADPTATPRFDGLRHPPESNEMRCISGVTPEDLAWMRYWRQRHRERQLKSQRMIAHG